MKKFVLQMIDEDMLPPSDSDSDSDGGQTSYNPNRQGAVTVDCLDIECGRIFGIVCRDQARVLARCNDLPRNNDCVDCRNCDRLCFGEVHLDAIPCVNRAESFSCLLR